MSKLNLSLNRGILFIILVSTVCSAADDPCDPPLTGCTCRKEMLDCTGETIDRFPILSDSTQFAIYSFSNCRIAQLQEVPYIHAVSLRINNCGVGKIKDGAFSNLTKLENLTISDNPLQEISNRTFSGLVKLKKLELLRNNLTKLPEGVFAGQSSLERIDLSGNKIEFTNRLFSPTSTLKHFLCMNCSLTSIPNTVLEDLSNLKRLCLMENSFTTLPAKKFQTFGSLQTLCLSKCGIKALDKEAFSGLTSLTQLYLGANEIKSIAKDTFKPFYESLKVLNLEANAMTSLRQDLAHWDLLEGLRLDDNPWVCDCGIGWLQSYDIHVDGQNITCAEPADLKGHNLLDKDTQKVCGTGGSAGTVLAVTIPLILLSVVLIVYYLRKIMLNKRRRAHEQLQSYNYHSVYGDTVESASSRQNIMS